MYVICTGGLSRENNNVKPIKRTYVGYNNVVKSTICV